MTACAVHAFKEWSTIVEALGAGAQTIIVRKGGIAEGRGGFDPTKAGRFWLLPTQFHAQREKLKPTAVQFVPSIDINGLAETTAPLVLRSFADLVAHRFLTDWREVAGLDAHHLWTETTVRERFDWAKPSGVHLLLVRVHRLDEPMVLPAGLDVGGCKSWVEFPPDLTPGIHSSKPVLDEATFSRARSALGF